MWTVGIVGKEPAPRLMWVVYNQLHPMPVLFFFFKQKTAYEIGLGIPAEPLFRSRVRNRRQLNSLQNTWPYGYSMPIAVRYTQDAFSRSGWLWPVDAKGEPLKATSYMAVGFYAAKYVNKKSDMDLAEIGRAVQQECRDRSRMPSSA